MERGKEGRKEGNSGGKGTPLLAGWTSGKVDGAAEPERRIAFSTTFQRRITFHSDEDAGDGSAAAVRAPLRASAKGALFV
jgi:hypothetical protein